MIVVVLVIAEESYLYVQWCWELYSVNNIYYF